MVGVERNVERGVKSCGRAEEKKEVRAVGQAAFHTHHPTQASESGDVASVGPQQTLSPLIKLTCLCGLDLDIPYFTGPSLIFTHSLDVSPHPPIIFANNFFFLFSYNHFWTRIQMMNLTVEKGMI